MLFSLMLCLAAAPSGAAPADVVATLRALDQSMLDAIGPGDQAVWARLLLPDALYLDESGVRFDRTALLKELTPLPKGISGHTTILEYQVHLDGDTALVFHRDREEENFHGQVLRNDYLNTETWLRRNGEWKLAMVHCYAALKDPPAVPLPASTLDAYVGRYRAAADLTYDIHREGDHLVGVSTGGTPHPLLAELQDVLFIAGQPRSRKLFQRDASGRVTGFAERREGTDVHWTRLP